MKKSIYYQIFVAFYLLVMSSNSYSLDEMNAFYTTNNSICYPSPEAMSAQALVAQLDTLGNSVAANPCGAPVVCTNPFTVTNVTETSYTVQSDCTGAFFTHPIFRNCPSGYTLDSALNKCIRTGNSMDKQTDCDSSATLNPINIATGNKYLNEIDYRGTQDGTLKVRRYYNSFEDLLYIPAQTSNGFNWRSEYDRYLSIELGITPPQVIAHRQDGKSFFFKQDNGHWVADSDVTGALTQSGSEWIYEAENNVTENYSSNGFLQSINYLNGNTETIAYDTEERLVSVTDNFGRSLVYTYDGNNRIQTITDPDSEVITYEYNSIANLSKVTYQDSETREYLYEEPNFNRAITKIIDENSNDFAVYQYDSQGRAISSEIAGGSERFDLVFNADGTTTVTDSLGSTNTYSFENLFGVLRTSDIDGGQCSYGCSSQGDAQTYDANGFLASRTDFEGNITNFINNTRGLQESRTEAVGSAEERTITTEWHPDFRLPTKITEPGKETLFTYDTQGRLLSRTEREI